MSTETMYAKLIVRYFAELLASKTDMSLQHALEAVDEPLRDEISTAEERGLYRINIPMGRMMTGRAHAPDIHTTFYVESIRAQHAGRWAREGVTEDDIVAWWDLGGVMHGAYVAFDNLFNIAQTLDSMEHAQGMESLEELSAYAKWSLAKRFPLFGPDDNDGTDGRLPQELRARIETWTRRARRESPDELAQGIDAFSSFNALCRYMIKRGEI
ncbi:hypothetical protein [Pseudarthrobacter sp. MDT3-1]